VSEQEIIAMMIKIEQLDMFKRVRNTSFREISEYFDRHNIWKFIDDAYYGLHVQGALATFDDITGYIQSIETREAI